jgi:GST-like protein
MLTLYTWDTTNGRKPIILLEEIGLPYEIRPVDLGAGAQHAPEFRALNPMQKIPVLVDEDAGTIFESNAILWHLATRTGQFLGEGQESLRVMQWLFVQGGSVAHPLGNYNILRNQIADPERIELARHRAEAEHVLTALEGVLTGQRYFAGQYSVADIAFLPQLRRELGEAEHEGRFPALRAWLERCLARPAVAKGLGLPIVAAG